MDEMRNEIERLEAELTDARQAVREHLLTVTAWYDDQPPILSAETSPFDPAWQDRYAELKAAAEDALRAANDAWERWAMRRSG